MKKIEKENKQPNADKSSVKKKGVKRPAIVPRETKASQLLKKRNQALSKDNSFDNSFTKKKRTMKPKVCVLGQDLESVEIEVKLDQSVEESKAVKATPSKRMTMKANANPYAANY